MCASRGSAASVSITPLINDSDLDGDTLTIVSVTTPAHGQAVIGDPRSTIVYTPTLNFNGVDVFTYTASDGALTAVATITVTVTSVNDLPTAVDDVAATNEDAAVDIAVLSNDSDVEPGALNIAAFSQPTHGTTQYVLINTQPMIKYTPRSTSAARMSSPTRWSMPAAARPLPPSTSRFIPSTMRPSPSTMRPPPPKTPPCRLRR